MKTSSIILTSVLVILIQMLPTGVAAAGTGTTTIQIQGYGTVHGQLQNALIQGNNIVTMSMFVNDQLRTPEGIFPLEATGDWNGVLSNSTFSGTIHNVQGKIHICEVFSCNDVEFSGQGNWTGQLQTGGIGIGNLTGTITITNSPYPQIAPGQTTPIYGTWSANFASSVPEFSSSLAVLLLATLMAVITLAHRKPRMTPHLPHKDHLRLDRAERHSLKASKLK